MDVKHVGDHECISCGKCMDSCAQGAISFKAGKITLAGPAFGKNADPEPVIEKRRRNGRIAWGIAIAVLVFALVWFNWIEPAREAAASAQREEASSAAGQMLKEDELVNTDSAVMKEIESAAEAASEATAAAETAETASEATAGAEASVPASDAPIGSEVGNVLPDFRTELLGGGEFHLADYRGNVVVLNFWGTTCTPCVEELPYFEKLKVEHPEVEILAIHNRAGAKKAEEFLADKGWDHLDFALDSKEKGLYALLEATDTMPRTIVLNPKGEVTYNVQAPLSYEQLEELVRQAQL